MNNLDYAYHNVTSVHQVLEEKWPCPRSEFEQGLLDKLLAAARQIKEANEKYATLSQEARRIPE